MQVEVIHHHAGDTRSVYCFEDDQLVKLTIADGVARITSFPEGTTRSIEIDTRGATVTVVRQPVATTPAPEHAGDPLVDVSMILAVMAAVVLVVAGSCISLGYGQWLLGLVVVLLGVLFILAAAHREDDMRDHRARTRG